ncbi:L-seryl-tRNA(Sec) selenium transferase [Spiroplasma alleghenense]|uniref:L-seryl-tRNA(Sec) selenium transferase n=1 Tax=Spiroplasma alleghenense TaxID=216931 RepID=A0A345Z2P2_9MOLU|nr:L-seryl-tRNA(Sec) selenium transferase [Spiroplasma alleghenense]AXK50871.1 L-seryl-tRNA(Ser) seleniumtransferase [Spiroplasma alleghenense]
MQNSRLQLIPSLNLLLGSDEIKKFPLLDSQKKQIINLVLKYLREEILKDKRFEPNLEFIIQKVITAFENNKNILTRVINATGTIIHTNLGRSVLPHQVISNLINVGSGYSNLELDLETGKRGARDLGVSQLMSKLVGAQDCIVVNNNAAAVFLTLNSLFKSKKVIISRGEEVEIGGSFRIPEIMKAAGVKLVEIGTTNRTHKEDYQNAINENNIKGILKIHQSNYKIDGFSKSVKIDELKSITNLEQIIIEDQGSGTLIDLGKYHPDLVSENTVQKSLAQGADLVLFSGDKLLGGLQAGIIVGNKELINKIKKNQLFRILRVNKLVLASLETILQIYLDEKEAIKTIPTLRMICEPIGEVEKRLQDCLKLVFNPELSLEVVDSSATIGGGSCPQTFFPSKALAIKSSKIKVQKIYDYFKNYQIPIITIIRKDEVLIDFKTVLEQDLEVVGDAINEFKY